MIGISIPAVLISCLLYTSGQKSMTNLVIDLILPCNIIFSFMIKFSSKIAQDFMVILIISILIQVFCVILGSVLYNKCSVKRKKCLRYATICSNAGFLGNPIAQGVYGMMGLTLASIYLIPQRIMTVSYTHLNADMNTGLNT